MNWRKRLTGWGATAFFLFLLSACGQAEDQEQSAEEELSAKPIEVEIDMPEEAEVGEEVEIGAFVTQEEEPVTDASEVLFEIWKDGEKEKSEEILAESAEEEKYSILYTFEEEGVFHVTAHVTARNMHSMPTKDIVIGKSEDEPQVEEQDEKEEQHEGHQHGSPVTVDLESGDIILGQEKDITFSVKFEGEPITNARVRLKIWKTGENTRDWVDAEEGKPGVYSASHLFQETGDHIMTVHIENDEGLHEHTDKLITVRE